MAGSSEPPLPPVLIELRGVYKGFGAAPVLRGVDLQIRKGSTLVILGVSGSGKTLLIKLMAGLIRPDRGQVIVEGRDLATLTDDEAAQLREKSGVVFQSSALFDGMTVFDNVALPIRERHSHWPEAKVAKQVRSRLALFDLLPAEGLLPEELSGGMRKRVALARAVVLDPEIVLYDEPTTGLDPLLTDSVDKMILRARQALGVTSVVICQDLAAAFEIADQLAFLDQGRIAVIGSKEEILRSPNAHLQQFLDTWKSVRAIALGTSPAKAGTAHALP